MQQVTTGEKTYCFYIGNSIREQRKRKSRRNCSLWRGVSKYRKINLHVICHEHFLEEKGGGSQYFSLQLTNTKQKNHRRGYRHLLDSNVRNLVNDH